MIAVTVTALRDCFVTTDKKQLHYAAGDHRKNPSAPSAYENTHGLHMLAGQELLLELTEAQLSHIRRHVEAGDIEADGLPPLPPPQPIAAPKPAPAPTQAAPRASTK